MAGELTIRIQASYSKNGAKWSRTIDKAVDVSGTAVQHAVQSVGTSEETLALGDVLPSGYAIFYNLDAANYVELGKATGSYSLKLKAGEAALVRLDSWPSIFAKADTAAIDLEYWLLPD